MKALNEPNPQQLKASLPSPECSSLLHREKGWSDSAYNQNLAFYPGLQLEVPTLNDPSPHLAIKVCGSGLSPSACTRE